MKAMVLPAVGRKLRLGKRPCRNRARVRSACASRPAASAAPTCTSSTANFPTSGCRSCRDTRSSASSRRSERASRLSRSADASAFPGWATPAASVPTARATRESLRSPALHRPQPRRRLRDPCRGRCRLTLFRSTATTLSRRAADVRRPDRLALAEACGRGQARSASTASVPRRTSSRRSADGRGGVFAFTRPGDATASLCALARRAWAGGSDRSPPEPLDAAILSRRSVRWCRPRCGPFARAVASSAPAST